MSWDTVEKKIAEQPSSSMFVRLPEDGSKIVGVFLGEPYAREVIWTGVSYETYSEETHKSDRPSLRVALNFFELKSKELKVYECGVVVFKDILRLREKYGLDKWSFEILRHGIGKDTTYSILPEDQLSSEQIEWLKTKVQLIDLAKVYES